MADFSGTRPESETLDTRAATSSERQYAESPDIEPELPAPMFDGRDAVSTMDDLVSDCPGVDGLVTPLAAAYHARVRARVEAGAG